MRSLRNWTYKEIVAFLLAHGFVELKSGHSGGGSHHYFDRVDDKGVHWFVHVQFHAKKSIAPGTMDTIVKTSGIPKLKWRMWSGKS